MIKRLFLIIVMITMLNQRCLDGCLRCNEMNVCLYCDVQQKYSLEFGRCIKKELPNCLKMNDKGRCELCIENHYLDNVSLVCVEFPENLKVQNCLYHSGPGLCLKCVEGYFEKNGGCFQITNPILDCKTENSRGSCMECKPQFILSIDKKKCIPKPETENCASFSNIKCNSCGSGYLRNENLYLNYIFGFSNAQQFQLLTEYYFNVKSQISDGFKFKTCQKKVVKDCLVFETADRCKKCSSGFFVNKDFKCEPIPEPTILNCTKYSSLTSCIDCAQGFYLHSPSQCVPINPIENCFLYQTNDDTSTCTKCTDNYYLSAENLCTLRTAISKIDFCEILAIDFEKCNKCQKGYTSTSDKMRCLPIIANCQTYNLSNRTYLSLSCNLCDNGFYYNQNDKICIQGTIPNCLVFNRLKNECVVCEPYYFLVGYYCRPHDSIQSCVSYSDSRQNICESCNQHNFLLKTEQMCLKVDRIENCKKYSTKTTCAECEDGFYLNNPSVCDLIPPAENCLKKQQIGDEYLCIQCRPSFVLFQNLCIVPFEYFTQGCENSNLNGLTSFNNLQCNSCSANHVPINYIDNYYCMEKKLADTLYGFDSTLDDDCLQYYINQTTNQPQCVKCRSGLFLDNGKCLANCQDVNNLTVYRQFITLHNLDGNDQNESIRIEKIDTCQATIPNCKVASLTLNQNLINPEYACEECVSEYLPIIKLGQFSKSVVKYIRKNEENNIQMPSTYAPEVLCQTNNDFLFFVGDVKQINERKFIENCEYYYSVDKKTLGCFKCQNGFTGKVISKVKNCLNYLDKNSCAKCEQGYFLKSLAECTAVQTILNCTIYDQTANSTICQKCSDDFYLDTNICKFRIQSYRKLYSTSSTISDVFTCIQDYALFNNECRRMPEMCQAVNNSFSCTLCNKTIAYLDGGICKLGTIANCIEYAPTSQTCTQCAYKYYILLNKCVLNVFPLGMNNNLLCTAYSQNTPFTCNTCSNGSKLFNILNKCVVKVNLDQYCDVWEDEYRCKDCKDGYYLNNLSKRCLVIPPENKCLRLRVRDIDNNVLLNISDEVQPNKYSHYCEKCQPKYYLTSVSKPITINNVTTNFSITQCNDYLEIMRTNCEISRVSGTVGFASGNGCTTCKANFYPMDFRKKYVCINKDYLPIKKPGFLVDQACRRYKYVNSVYLCERCIYPKFLDETNGVCVDTCPTGVKIIIRFVSNVLIKNNYCGALPADVVALDGCDEYIESFTNTGDYSFDFNVSQKDKAFKLACAKCLPNRVPTFVLGVGNQKTTFIDVNKGNDKYEFVHDRVSLPIECLSVQTTNGAALTVDRVIGLKNTATKLIDNCELYTHLDPVDKLENFYGCFKCRWGFTGRVNNYLKVGGTISYGYIEYCQEIVDCDVNVKYGGLHANKGFIQNNGSIHNYFTCHKCTGTKVLVSFLKWDSTSTPLKIIGLKAFRYNSDKTTGTVDSETNITLEEYSNTLMCMDKAQLMNADSPIAPETKKYKVFDTAITSDNEFCGLRMVSTGNKGAVDATSYRCLICLPGYTATYDTDFVLGSCTVMSNANADKTLEKTFNNVSTCTFVYDPIKKIVTYETCFTSNVTNCLAAFTKNSVDICVICRPGFELHTDNTCLAITTPTCKATNYTKNSLITLKKEFVDVNYFIYSQVEVEGCLECTFLSDILVYHANDINIDNYICATPYVGQYNLIPNCELISWENDKIFCQKCISGNILIGKDICESDTNYQLNLPNCVFTEDKLGSICKKCKPDTVTDKFLNIGGWCVAILATSTPTNDAIQNCITYDTVLSELYTKAACLQCQGDFYAQNAEPYNCVAIPVPFCSVFSDNLGCSKCKKGYGLIEKNVEGILTEKICIPLNVENNGNLFDHDNDCQELEIVGNDALQKFNLRCKSCNTGVLREIANVQSQTNWCYTVVKSTTNCSTYDLPADPVVLTTAKLFCTSCLVKSDNYFYLNNRTCPTRTVINNCKEYEEKINRCAVCNIGYLLDENGENCLLIESWRYGYIETCKKMDSCNDNIYYDGLSSDLRSIFSCHKCIKPNEIPIAAAEFEFKADRPGFFQMTNLTRFSYKSSTTIYNDFEGNESVVQCMEINQTNLGITSPNGFAFPANCALALTKVNNSLKDNSSSVLNNVLPITKLAVTCAACKPGFAPTYANSTQTITSRVNYMVSACTTIQNCQFSRWFNGCSQCEPNYSFGFNNQDGINFGVCIQYQENPNCLSVEVILTTKKCRFCKKGSFLNKDGYCEMIKPTKCKFQEFKFRGFYAKNDIHFGLLDYKKNVGCSECEEGFIGIYADQDKFICTQSLYHSQNLVPVNTFYRAKCQNYSINLKGLLVCSVCKTGYVVSESGVCLLQTNLTNCQKACDSNLCSVCNPGFVLLNRSCVLGSIQNCLLYGNNKLLNDRNCNMYGLEKQVCIQCIDEFYLNSGVCLKGEVPNCKFMETQYVCNECQANFTLVKMKDGKSYCYPIDPKFNCRKFDSKKLQSSILNCLECFGDNFIKSESKSDFFEKSCMKFRFEPNCIMYNNNPIAIADSSFVCTGCNQITFLQNGSCQMRLIKPEQCSTFDKFADKCVECFSGYFLSLDKTHCLPYPQGLNGCRTYTTKTICKDCETGKYLREGLCQPVKVELPNCLYYEDEETCSECKSGYLNIKGKCLIANAKGCMTYDGVDACKSCSADSGLKLENGILNCVQQTIPNCAIFDDLEPYKCTQCNAEFYVNSQGVCTAVTTQILNCLIYSENNICQKCSPGSALSQDKLNCLFTPDIIVNIDRNCNDSVIPSSPVCNTCKPGYKFSYGKCIACNKELIDAGCGNCHPNFPDVCLICAEGWINTQEGICVRPIIETSGIVGV